MTAQADIELKSTIRIRDVKRQLVTTESTGAAELLVRAPQFRPAWSTHGPSCAQCLRSRVGPQGSIRFSSDNVPHG